MLLYEFQAEDYVRYLLQNINKIVPLLPAITNVDVIDRGKMVLTYM